MTTSLKSQNFNRPVPPGYLHPYEFKQYDTTDYGYYLTTPFTTYKFPVDSALTRGLLLDKDGFIVWFWTKSEPGMIYDFQYHPQNKMFSCFCPNYFLLLDSSFKINHYFDNYEGLRIDMHEFQILRNGNAAFFMFRDTLIKIPAWAKDSVIGSDSAKIKNFYIIEFDNENNLIFNWNLLKNVPIEMTYAKWRNILPFDYAHPNAISEDSDGNLLVSFCNLNAVYKIDHKTGKVLWRLGGKKSSFVFTNDNGFSAQHDIRCLADGTYSLYDNTDCATQETRALIYSLDTLKWTATKVWEYRSTPEFYAPIAGNHQVTDNHNHLINYGFERRPYPTMDFIDNNCKKISQIFFADSVKSYRSYIYKLPFTLPRPKIIGNNYKDSIVLTAPSGYQRYLWSTGGTSESITVKKAGVYQVWVNYGIGMLGSKPFFYNKSPKTKK